MQSGRRTDQWLKKYGNKRVLHEHDDKQDFPHPIYTFFLDTVKSLGVQKITHNLPAEVDIIFEYFESFVSAVWNRGREI